MTRDEFFDKIECENKFISVLSVKEHPVYSENYGELLRRSAHLFYGYFDTLAFKLHPKTVEDLIYDINRYIVSHGCDFFIIKSLFVKGMDGSDEDDEDNEKEIMGIFAVGKLSNCNLEGSFSK